MLNTINYTNIKSEYFKFNIEMYSISDLRNRFHAQNRQQRN